MDQNIDIERINFTCVGSGTKKVSYRTRSGNKSIIGICLVSHSGDPALVGKAMKMTIDKHEVFPADFDPSLLGFSQKTPVNDRFYDYINRPINQSDIEIEFADLLSGADTNFSILLKCETE